MRDDYSTKELAEIYNKLNNWEWDFRLGVKPAEWDELPKFKTKNEYSYLTKNKIIKPYMILIRRAIGEKECLRWHHLNNLSRTNFQFEMYWLKRKLNEIFTVS